MWQRWHLCKHTWQFHMYMCGWLHRSSLHCRYAYAWVYTCTTRCMSSYLSNHEGNLQTRSKLLCISFMAKLLALDYLFTSNASTVTHNGKKITQQLCMLHQYHTTRVVSTVSAWWFVTVATDMCVISGCRLLQRVSVYYLCWALCMYCGKGLL